MSSKISLWIKFCEEKRSFAFYGRVIVGELNFKALAWQRPWLSQTEGDRQKGGEADAELLTLSAVCGILEHRAVFTSPRPWLMPTSPSRYIKREQAAEHRKKASKSVRTLEGFIYPKLICKWAPSPSVYSPSLADWVELVLLNISTSGSEKVSVFPACKMVVTRFVSRWAPRRGRAKLSSRASLW